ncbi:hypothetical protein TNCV_1479131 [Trichonephila clavipes]|nr:hypothetical protein TNCV_1479131 [Trichonephila clavipes]
MLENDEDVNVGIPNTLKISYREGLKTIETPFSILNKVCRSSNNNWLGFSFGAMGRKLGIAPRALMKYGALLVTDMVMGFAERDEEGFKTSEYEFMALPRKS